MEWKMGEKYFFKLEYGAVYNGVLLEIDDRFENRVLTIKDKFGNMVGFRESTIIKFSQESNSKPKNELTTKVNNYSGKNN